MSRTSRPSPVSPTSTGRRTASSPRCCRRRGPLGERLAAHRRRDAVPRRPARRRRPGAVAGAAGPGGLALRTPAGRGGRVPRRRRRARGAPCTPTPARTARSCRSTRVRGHGAAGCRGSSRTRRTPATTSSASAPRRAAARGRVELGVTVARFAADRGVRGARRVRARRRGRAADGGRGRRQVLATAGVRTDGALAERLDPVLAVLRRARWTRRCCCTATAARPRTRSSRREAHLRRWLLLDAGTRAAGGRRTRPPAVARAGRRLGRGRRDGAGVAGTGRGRTRSPSTVGCSTTRLAPSALRSPNEYVEL